MFVCVVVFILSVFFVGNFTLPLKCKVQMSGETEVSCDLSLATILKEIPPSNQIFAVINGTQSHDDLFRYSKWE